MRRVATLLVVDDSATARLVLQQMLETAGYRVVTTIDGVNALKILKKNDPPIDAVISDLRMPHMDGLELKHEADLACGRPIPFVLVTAAPKPDDTAAALSIGSAAV